jgi:uncharacterized membrane protein
MATDSLPHTHHTDTTPLPLPDPQWLLAAAATALLLLLGYLAGGAATAPIMMHLTTVVPAAVVGTAVLLLPKGTRTHTLLGRQWVLLMIATSLVSFFILRDGLSAIHVLSVITLVSVAVGVRAARLRRLRTHIPCMVIAYISTFIAGAFAVLLPGRFLYQALLG